MAYLDYIVNYHNVVKGIKMKITKHLNKGIIILVVVLLFSHIQVFAYSDKTTGITFDVPSNWQEIGSYTANGFLYNQFYMENGSIFNYGQAEYLGTESINESDFESMVSDIGISFANIEGGYKIGSEEYILIKGTYIGGNASTPICVLAYVGKGYMYMFFIMSSYNETEFKSAIKLIESIVYPTNPNYKPMSSSSSDIVEKGLVGFWMAAILSGGAAIVAALKKKVSASTHNSAPSSNANSSVNLNNGDNSQINKVKPSSIIEVENSAPIIENENSETEVDSMTEIIEQREINFCRNCGANLLLNVNFCPHCGTEVRNRNDKLNL